MEQSGPYAEIIVDLNTRKTDRVFHYAIPQQYRDILKVGSRVSVPFGNRRLAGYVVGFGYPEDKSVKNIKEILDVLDQEPLFTPELLELSRWMAENYICSKAEALGRIVSPRLQVKSVRGVKVLCPALTEEKLLEVLSSGLLPQKQATVLRKALKSGDITRKELAVAAEVSAGTVDALVAKGLLKISYKSSGFAAPSEEISLPQSGFQLNPHQLAALKRITGDLKQRKFGAFLLHGVTGSGKTEVYLGAIAAALGTGRQAVTLVPEISLTPQMVELFRSRFGTRVAILHSALSGRERYDEWKRVKAGEATVVLGTRSAAFAPLPRPGLFIIDEEHDPSYKQGDHLRYHAREIALKRAQLCGAVVVLGSATPSLESQYRFSLGGPYKLLTLPHRIDHRPLPMVRVVDMRRELKEGNRGIFSRDLVEAVAQCLSRGEQALLFLNRRGYTTFVVCRECGLVLKCPHCDISLTYHLDGRLRCHYCNHTKKTPELCPDCGSVYIRHFGAGTQKVEEEAKKLFPEARILRMDSDSTAYKGSHYKILKTFQDGQADILIGTQMVAKGLDLPAVTMVGVVNADTSLHMPDFRAAERTFQLLTQVAGRAGRGERAGEVLVQTYCPGHYSIIAAASHDCQGFYRCEMPARKTMGYPPFSHLALLLFTHKDEEEVKKGAQFARGLFEQAALGQEDKIHLLGPAPAPLSKIKERYRWQLVLKSHRRSSLKLVIREVLEILEKDRRFSPVINVDINPQGIF